MTSPHTRAQAAATIADLERRVAALDADAAPLRKQLANLDSTAARFRNTLAEARAELARCEEAPRVSDHAVIRYLERHHGFCFEAVRSALLTPAVIAAIDAGAESVRRGGGVLKIKGRCVTTFVAPGTAGPDNIPKQDAETIGLFSGAIGGNDCAANRR